MALLFAMPEWTFQTDLVGGLPEGWQSRGGSAADVYRIEDEPNGNRFVEARSWNSDVQLGTTVSVRPEQLPILSWRWRVWNLPRNADERQVKTMDSAASVYAVFGSRLFPKVLKYVWSASAPVGATFKHPASSRMAIIVIESGVDHVGEWQKVSRNLLGDYRSAFGTSPGNLIALGIKTDSDSTRSSARADYDDFRVDVAR
jgi:hypothetical protein